MKAARVPRRRVLAALLCLAAAVTSSRAAPLALGDVTRDGAVDGRDVRALSAALDGDAGGLDTRWRDAADVDRDGSVGAADLAFLTALRDEELRDPDGPLAAFLRAFLGIDRCDPSDLQRLLRRLATLDDEGRERSLGLLLPCLERGGGRRFASPDEPGAALGVPPRDALVLMVAETLGEATAAAATPDDRRRCLDLLRRLEAVATSGPRSLQPETGRWLRDRMDLMGVALRRPAQARDAGSPNLPAASPGAPPAVWPLAAATLMALGLGLGVLLGRGPRREGPPRQEPAPLVVLRERSAPTAAATPSGGVPFPGDALPPVRYQVLATLGGGGQGIVYKADDRDLHRVVAVKMLGAESGSALKRLLREAATMAALRHPGIPGIFDVHAEAPPYIVMEFIEGRSLRTLLQTERPPRATARRWVAQLLDVIAACHDAGVLHRDVKPDNVLVDVTGRIRLIDFGLVRREEDTRLTWEGDMVGTLAYLAPEQFGSDSASPRSDLYACGLVAIELLTGAYAFASPHPFPPQVFQEPLPPHETEPDIEPGLSTLLLKMVAPDPDDRPRDARTVLAELSALGVSC